MIVKLTYFKPSGKYYTDSVYNANATTLHDVCAEVRNLKEEKGLPGLAAGHSDFIVLVIVDEVPYLIL